MVVLKSFLGTNGELLEKYAVLEVDDALLVNESTASHIFSRHQICLLQLRLLRAHLNEHHSAVLSCSRRCISIPSVPLATSKLLIRC